MESEFAEKSARPWQDSNLWTPTPLLGHRATIVMEPFKFWVESDDFNTILTGQSLQMQ